MKKLIIASMVALMAIPAHAASLEATCNDYGYWKERKHMDDDSIKDIVLLAKRKRVTDKDGFKGSNNRICRDEMERGEDRAKREYRQKKRRDKNKDKWDD